MSVYYHTINCNIKVIKENIGIGNFLLDFAFNVYILFYKHVEL